MFEIRRAQFLKSKLDVSGTLEYWLRLTVFLTIINIIFAVVVSKFIVATRVYLPSILIIAQIVYYKVSTIETINAIGGEVYNLSLFIFYFVSCLISVPLIIFSWFKLGKKYTKRSAYSVCNYFIIASLFSFKAINEATIWNFIDLGVPQELEERIDSIRYYFIALFGGASIGVLISFLWKNQISAGGLDYLYTYLAIVKKTNTRRVSIPLNIIFVTLGIIFVEILIKGQDIAPVSFILCLIASLIFSYTSLRVVENLYPKFKIINLWIVTNKGGKVAEELKKRYKRGGIIINAIGLYEQKDKKIINTVVTFVEKDELTKLIHEIDPNGFIIFQPVAGIWGKFKYPLI